MEVEGRKGSHGVKLRSKKERVRGMGRGSTSINAHPVCSRSLLATAGKRARTRALEAFNSVSLLTCD